MIESRRSINIPMLAILAASNWKNQCEKRKIGNMRKGPKWSNEGVRALMLVVRSRLEAVDGMGDEQLDTECKKRFELERYVGKNKDMKATALKEWIWKHSIDGDVGEIVESAKPLEEEVNLEEELKKVVELLRINGTATDGGIRNLLFLKKDKVCERVLEYGFSTGKIKRTKTLSGTEIITNA